MPKGWCPEYFYHNPNLESEKSLEQIWEEIQYYSGEFFPDDSMHYKRQTDFMVPLPPLLYEGKFVKGMFLSEGVDYIHSMFPRINELFFSMAYTMWSSIPYSEKAEVYLTCYDYPEREAWFKNINPHKAGKIFIPLQDADFTNEYAISPTWATPKDIDVLCISRISGVKNLPILIKALKHYHEKYGVILKTVLITGVQNKEFNQDELKILEDLENIVGGKEELEKYVEILGRVNHGRDLNTYYSRAKLVVLTSIYEGKNRTINESLCCNTPVIVYKDLSKYTRGQDHAFPEGAGLYVPEFNPESMADTIHDGLTHLEHFTPRRSYLRTNGRKNFLNKCIDSIPYYKEHLPEYEPGRAMENLWLDLAMQENYQLSLNAFLYAANPAIHHVKLSEEETGIMDFFNARFMITGGEKILPQKEESNV